MADFLFSTRRRAPDALSAALLRFLGPVAARMREHHGAWGSLALLEGEHDEAVLVEDEQGITVVVGDPLVTTSSHGRGPCPLHGRREALHARLLAGAPTDWRQWLDGHYAVLAMGSSGVRLLTDRFAFVPVFAAEARDDARVLGTQVDAVAVAAGRGRSIDPASAVDLVANLSCTPPWTLYECVRQCEPASDVRIASDGSQTELTYWAPRESNPFGDAREAAVALRDALLADVRDATGATDGTGLLLSGGEDSRAVLGAVPRDRSVRAVIYAEWISREVRIARRAARAYGAELRVGLRSPDHYAAGFEVTAGLVGSYHLFIDVHGNGLYRSLGLHHMPVVLGGLSADSLLKGTYADGAAARHRTHPGLDPELQQEVGRRRRARREFLAGLRPDTADEWMSLWPFSMRKHGGNVDGNRRQFRVHEVFHAGTVLDIAAAVPVGWKLHRRLFREAVRPLLAGSWYVPHTKPRYPYFGIAGNAALVPGLLVARGLRALATGRIRARHGPWPKWRSVADSEAMRRRMRESHPRESPIGPVFGAVDRASLDALLAEWPALSRLMLIQIAHLATLAGES